LADWLEASPIGQAIPIVGEVIDIAQTFVDIFNIGVPTFRGNVAASQSGKSVPNVPTAASDPWDGHTFAQQVFQGPGSGSMQPRRWKWCH
jgi:hypothetical protein